MAVKYFQIYNTASGALVSIGSEGHIADPLPDGLSMEELISVPFRGDGKPDLSAHEWDRGITAFVPRPPDADEVSRQALKGKPSETWTPAEAAEAQRLLRWLISLLRWFPLLRWVFWVRSSTMEGARSA